MSCPKVLSMLSAYIDGEVQGSDAMMIKDHLAVCDSCAREFHQLQSTANLLKATPEIEPPAFLLEQIEAATVNRPTLVARLRTAIEPIRRAPQYVRWAAASAVAAAALMVMLVSQPGVQQTPLAPAIAPDSPSSSVVVVEPEGEPAETSTAQPDLHAVIVREVQPVRRPLLQRRNDREHPESPVVTFPAENGKPVVPARDLSVTEQIEQTDADHERVDPAVPRAPVIATEPSEAEDVVIVVKTEPAATQLEEVGASESADSRVQQNDDVFAGLREKIAARNKQRRYDTTVERIEGRKYSVELASVRF